MPEPLWLSLLGNVLLPPSLFSRPFRVYVLTRNLLAAQVTHYVILDDRADAADDELLPHFVQTDPAVGLTDGHVARALKLLG